MLDPATRVAELGLNATSHIVVLSTSIAPSQQQQQQQGARPLFDPAAVSGLLAQLNLQFQQQVVLNERFVFAKFNLFGSSNRRLLLALAAAKKR
jgi:hypothetical protein